LSKELANELKEKGEAAGVLGKSVFEEAQARLWHDKLLAENDLQS